VSFAPLTVRIKSAPEKAWYRPYVGQTFGVRPIKAEFKGHVYRYNMYEVMDFAFEGDVIWPSDCEVVSCQ
jgi:hypothetical protein